MLELGTGTGLTALWLLRCARPARLTLTDYVPGVLQNLRDNLAFSAYQRILAAVCLARQMASQRMRHSRCDALIGSGRRVSRFNRA